MPDIDLPSDITRPTRRQSEPVWSLSIEQYFSRRATPNSRDKSLLVRHLELFLVINHDDGKLLVFVACLLFQIYLDFVLGLLKVNIELIGKQGPCRERTCRREILLQCMYTKTSTMMLFVISPFKF